MIVYRLVPMALNKLAAGPVVRPLSLSSLATSPWSILCSAELPDELVYTSPPGTDHKAILHILSRTMTRAVALMLGARSSVIRCLFRQTPNGTPWVTNKWSYQPPDSNHLRALLVRVTGRPTARAAKVEGSKWSMKRLFIAQKSRLGHDRKW